MSIFMFLINKRIDELKELRREVNDRMEKVENLFRKVLEVESGKED